MNNTDTQIIGKRTFICCGCWQEYYADVSRDNECRQEFIDRYGHTPEETKDDEIVSLCDYCNSRLIFK